MSTRWYWLLAILFIGLAAKATVEFLGGRIWDYVMTPPEQAACMSTGYSDEVVIAGCSAMIRSGAYEGLDLATLYVRRGSAFDRRRQFEHAMEDFTQALELDPRNYTALYNRAALFQRQSRFGEAIKDLDRILAALPDNADALISRAYSYRVIANYAAARRDIDRAIERGAGAAAFHERSWIMLGLEDRESAIRDLDRAIELDPRDPENYDRRGRLYFVAKAYERAIADFTYALDLRPNDPSVLMLRGESHERAGNRAAAITDYRRVLATAPGNLAAQSALGRLGVVEDVEEEKHCHGPYPEREPRIAACSRAIESGRLPKDRLIDALLMRAGLHMGRPGGIGEAANDVDRAAELAPNNVRVITMHGAIAMRLNSHKRALTSFERAIKLEPASATGRMGRGLALVELRRYAEAISEFDWVIERYPLMPDTYLGRGRAHEALGRREAAIKDYRAAYRNSPGWTEARQALARLGEEP